MLVVERNKTFINWTCEQDLRPMQYSGEVVVVFDPSKSNMAMVVGTPAGDILNTIEFSGNNRKRGPVMDTTLYCEEVRAFLKIYLSKVNLFCVAVEQAITPKNGAFHHSNMVLTEIRANLLNFFLDTFGISVIEVNNWAWKHAVLPEGYRSPFEKGSKKWFVQTMSDSPYAHYFEADMTDCICIYWYIISTKCSTYKCYCNRAEVCESEIMYFYTPISNNITDDMQEMAYNSRFSLSENMSFYANRVLGYFYMKVPIDAVDIVDVYNKTVSYEYDNLHDSEVKVVAKRK